MRLALLGHSIQHSLSPALYKNFLGAQLTDYQLLDYADASAIPTLAELATRLDGLNITAPYKSHFVSQVQIDSKLVRKLNAINTISFTDKGPVATNTDLLAVESLLQEYQKQFADLEILLLGSGAMARMTELVANQLNIPLKSFSRKAGDDLEKLDLTDTSSAKTPLVINSCSRSFIFHGQLPARAVFWDYNYRFPQHAQHIPQQVTRYIDGEEMLRRQALSAIQFWYESNPKLKC